MLKGLSSKYIGVLMEFTNLKRNKDGSCWYFELNNSEYSIYSYEKEILLTDNIPFEVIDIYDECHL